MTVAVLVETATCGDCGMEDDVCLQLEKRSTQMVLLEIVLEKKDPSLSIEDEEALELSEWQDIEAWGGGIEHNVLLTRI